jgi:hypothetical protein
LLGLFVQHGFLADAEPLRRWWFAERTPAEPLANFLLRQEICSQAAPVMVGLFRAVTLPTVSVKRLLHPEHGAQRLRLLTALPPVEAPPSTITVTVAAVSSTVAPCAASTCAELIGPLVYGADKPVEPVCRGPGTVLGRCLLLEQIGRGASGVVYRGLHRSLNIPVAIKLLRAAVLAGPEEHARFRTEARLLAQLNHPHIVRVWDYDDDPDQPYVVLEFVEGINLAELLAQCGRLQPARVWDLMRQVLEGLRAAHALGIVHRDIKPANMLLTRSGQVKIADLGLAVIPGSESERSAQSIAGTAAYMAPEQAQGSPLLDHRADMYGVGAMVYHLLTGTPPFTGRSSMEIICRLLQDAVVPPLGIVPDLSPRGNALILRLLAKQPEERFATYDEVLAELDVIQAALRSAESRSSWSKLWSWLRGSAS